MLHDFSDLCSHDYCMTITVSYPDAIVWARNSSSSFTLFFHLCGFFSCARSETVVVCKAQWDIVCDIGVNKFYFNVLDSVISYFIFSAQAQHQKHIAVSFCLFF